MGTTSRLVGGLLELLYTAVTSSWLGIMAPAELTTGGTMITTNPSINAGAGRRRCAQQPADHAAGDRLGIVVWQ